MVDIKRPIAKCRRGQVEAAERFEFRQPRASLLMKGKINKFAWIP
ncbi:MAG: hypothetical protein V4564_25780 [Pseudomonadota bacterium]|nr:hypothetical protein [Sphingomonas sp. ERG5]